MRLPGSTGGPPPGVGAALRLLAHRLLNHALLALRRHLRRGCRIRSFVGGRRSPVRRFGCPVGRSLRGLRVGSRLLDRGAVALTHA